MKPTMTRRQAHDAGLKRYYTGRPCLKGHDSERFVTTGGCVKCNAERSTLFRSSNTVASVSRLRGWFSYPLHPDDYAAALAYCQGLDMARSRIPHVPDAPPPVDEITPERIREMRALALGRVVDLVGTQDSPRVDASEAWMRDTK
jgi:hypothetical protein